MLVKKVWKWFNGAALLPDYTIFLPCVYNHLSKTTSSSNFSMNTSQMTTVQRPQHKSSETVREVNFFLLIKNVPICTYVYIIPNIVTCVW